MNVVGNQLENERISSSLQWILAVSTYTESFEPIIYDFLTVLAQPYLPASADYCSRGLRFIVPMSVRINFQSRLGWPCTRDYTQRGDASLVEAQA
jgi:hypothetical protein